MGCWPNRAWNKAVRERRIRRLRQKPRAWVFALVALYIALCLVERVSAWWPRNTKLTKLRMMPKSGTISSSGAENTVAGKCVARNGW